MKELNSCMKKIKEDIERTYNSDPVKIRREMRSFMKETDKRLTEIEKKLERLVNQHTVFK